VKSIHRALGVDISGYLGADTEIGAAMKTAVANNVALIKSIPEEYLGKVSAKVQSYFAAGKRWESLAEELERLGDVTYNRARFIARDQASKLNASFNEVRQTQIGITQYVWSTAHDERVRKSHAALDGTTQAWASPPLISGEPLNPGEDYNCRCGAIPKIDLSDSEAPAAAAQAEER
jgi:SPP1 gp7 family putative phage head morphogenesis protein